MKHPIKLVVLSGLIAMSAQAFADNTSSDPSSTDKSQAMKDCMAKQKATNSGMTNEAMKTTCKNEVSGKKGQNGNDLATGPQAKPQG